ncbi:hypothetical protein HMPREF1049_0188 [Fusobacterium necrophorum subsp. funduliforme ATCC 51357]|nr:hypothetical protein HMPREF1049_0188 [Fusobacterium necrophorum subsp. funduliforme ATCC 51357]
MPLTCQAVEEIYGKYFRYFDFSFSFQYYLTEKLKKRIFKISFLKSLKSS